MTGDEDDYYYPTKEHIAAVFQNGPEAADLITQLRARAEAAERERDALKLQAQSWAAEAKGQRATVHGCLQAASGATGEKADWNGSVPIKERIAQLETERDGAWNAAIDALPSTSEDRFWTDGNCSWSKFLTDNFEEEIRALKRPETTK